MKTHPVGTEVFHVDRLVLKIIILIIIIIISSSSSSIVVLLFFIAQYQNTARGGVVGWGTDSRCCHLNFSLTLSFRPHYDSGFDSASDRYEYQEYSWGVKEVGT